MSETSVDSPAYTWSPDTIKGSERFFDLLKIENDRLTNKLRVGDDRARGNNTMALAAIGVMTLLRTTTDNLPIWMVVGVLGLVLGVLGTGIAIVFGRNTTAIKPESLLRELDDLWERERPYMEIMHSHQKGIISNIRELDRLQRVKYRLLDIQNILMALLVSSLAFTLAWLALSKMEA